MLASRLAGAPRDPSIRAGGVLFVGVLLLAGCGTPPELLATPSPTPSPTSVRTGSTGPATADPAPRTPAPTPTRDATPAGTVAVACPGRPTSAEVITLLRREPGLLPDRLRVTARTGPLCAADWQYTVVEAAGHEPLQAVTRTRSGGFTLVTAGTDVCAIPVRAAAPPAIQTLACDGPAGGLPPA